MGDGGGAAAGGTPDDEGASACTSVGEQQLTDGAVVEAAVGDEDGDEEYEEGDGGGVEHGGRGGGRGEPSLSTAVRSVGVNYDVISLVMAGSSIGDPPFKCAVRAKEIRKRKLPAGATFDKAAARRAATEISDLKKQLASVTAKLNQTKANFAHQVGVQVRLGVRKARAATDVSIHLELNSLKEELAQQRRVTSIKTHHNKLAERIAHLESELLARDAEIKRLNAVVAAGEKVEALGKRRLASVNHSAKQHSAEQEAREAALKKQAKELRAQEVKLQDKAAECKRLEGELKAAAAREAEQAETVTALEAKIAASASLMASMEQDCKAALLEKKGEHEAAVLKMESKHETALDGAEARAKKLLQKLSDESAKQFPKSRPKGHTADAFESLSEVAQRQARHRDVEYASWFLQQREWRVEDWVTVIAKQGWLEAFWESKDVWDFRMDWARTLLASCMSTHWGAKLGLYLTLTEHVPTRQIRRINQATPPPLAFPQS
eukprot:3627610-Pleurochrysis_carterae.AAC.1